MSNNKPPLTSDQVEFSERIRNLQLKTIVTIVFLVCMVGVLVSLVFLCFIPSTDVSKIVLGAIEGIMAYTVGPLAKHFFPALNKTVRSGKPKISKVT